MNKILNNNLTTNQKDLLLTLLLFLLSFGVFSLKWDFSLTTDWDLNLFEGVSTVGAERILRGEIPYRDFWTIYAPGHFYLLAFIFKNFGKHLMIEVIAASIFTSTAVCVSYWIGRTLSENRSLALFSSIIFIGGMYYTDYFLRIGSFSVGILIVFFILLLVLRFYRNPKSVYLVWSGLLTGILFIFKHDVGVYTSFAIGVGLVCHYFLTSKPVGEKLFTLVKRVGVYVVGVIIPALPVVIYFGIAAGEEMLQNLVVFPLTDFRFSRPENYPEIFEIRFLNSEGYRFYDLFSEYLIFTIPFLFIMLGIYTVWFSVKKKKPFYAVSGITFISAYLFHYNAAHVQINTHIVTMSVYASWMGIIIFELVQQSKQSRIGLFLKSVLTVVIIVWITALFLKPGYLLWQGYEKRNYVFNMDKISGFRGEEYQIRGIKALKKYVDDNIPIEQPIYIGLHRHDVVIIGDVMSYFILDRPIATKYNELHPAIADTSKVQQEIISEIIEHDLKVVFIKHIFADEELEREKINFQNNLPQIGATDLDNFIRENFRLVRSIDTFEIWERKN